MLSVGLAICGGLVFESGYVTIPFIRGTQESKPPGPEPTINQIKKIKAHTKKTNGNPTHGVTALWDPYKWPKIMGFIGVMGPLLVGG